MIEQQQANQVTSLLSPPQSARPGIAFGPFRLYPTERLLERDGEPVEIGGRAMDLLIRLTEKPSEIVSKRDLIASAWQNLTVEESSLRFHIVNLRKALGDGQLGTRYITNVSGRGYCFVAPVYSADTMPPGTQTLVIRSKLSNDSAALTAIPDLPRLHDRILGRQEIIEQIAAQLKSKRFVTIHGQGGVGKTTVAVAVTHSLVRQFEGRVHFLDLGTLNDQALLASSLATSLGITALANDATPAIIDYLRERSLLIVLDCCEHVIQAVAELAERIYQEAPRVSILATSRERLRVEGESAVSLLPLDSPAADEAISANEIGKYPATELFAERAASAFDDETITDSDAEIIASICRKLDGNALAIELVAGQVATYGLQETANLLDSRFGLLFQGRRTAAPRHQTLKATVDWSYQLLNDEEKRLLQRLSIYVGPFNVSDAEAIGRVDEDRKLDVLSSLEALVEKSLLVVQRESGVVRYRLLDSTKAYASEQMAGGEELRALKSRYAKHLVARLQKQRNEDLPPARARAENRMLLGDITSALRWVFSSEGDKDLGPILAAGAASLFISLSMLNECRRWCERALEMLPDTESTAKISLQLSAALGHSLMLTEGNRHQARSAMERALALAERLDDKPNRFRLLCRLHMYFRRTGEVSKLVPIATELEQLANELGDPAAMSAAHTLLSVGYHLVGDQVAAQTHIDLVFHLNEFSKIQPSHYAFHRSPFIASARCHWLRGYPDQARAMASTLEEQSKSPDAVTYCIALIWGATVFQWLRDWKRVDSFAKRLIVHARDHSLRPYQVVGLAIEGETLLADGQLNAGLALIRSAVATLHAEQYELYTPRFEGSMARTLLKQGKSDEARRMIDGTIAGIRKDGEFFESPELLRIRGRIMAQQGDLEGATASIHGSMQMADQQGALAWRLRAAMSNVRLFRAGSKGPDAVADLKATYARFTEGFDSPDLIDAKRLIEDYA